VITGGADERRSVTIGAEFDGIESHAAPVVVVQVV
jgi:hypothetical protein